MAKADAWGAPGRTVFATRGAARRKFGLAGNARLFAEPTYRKLLASEPLLRRLIPTLIVIFLLVEPLGLGKLYANIRDYFLVWPFDQFKK